jgi:hypothetical protein
MKSLCVPFLTLFALFHGCAYRRSIPLVKRKTASAAPAAAPATSAAAAASTSASASAAASASASSSAAASEEPNEDEEAPASETKSSSSGRGSKAERGVVRRDANGNPILPLAVKGGVTVHALGRIVTDRASFHKHNVIWPVGFVSTRLYSSMLDPNKKVEYRSTIKDDGTNPVFVVTPADTDPVQSHTASAVWTEVVKRVNDLKVNKRARNSVSGPEVLLLDTPPLFLSSSLWQAPDSCAACCRCMVCPIPRFEGCSRSCPVWTNSPTTRNSHNSRRLPDFVLLLAAPASSDFLFLGSFRSSFSRSKHDLTESAHRSRSPGMAGVWGQHQSNCQQTGHSSFGY